MPYNALRNLQTMLRPPRVEVVVGERKMKKTLQMGEARQNVVVCRSEAGEWRSSASLCLLQQRDDDYGEGEGEEQQHSGVQQARRDVNG